MPKVTDLAIQKQSGSSGTYFASWSFDASTKNPSGTSGSSGSIKQGDLVSILAGATYYNGVAIPEFVLNDRWYVYEVIGDRAVINENASKTNSIMSPINVKYLDNGSGGSSGGGGGGGEGADESTVDHYTVQWYYFTGQGVWFDGGSSDVTLKNATYNAPDNANQIKVTVTPVAKTHTVNDEEVAYWTGSAVSATYSFDLDPPEVPPSPDVTIEGFTLTAKVENISDPWTDKIKFQVVKGTKLAYSGTATVQTCRATYSCTITAGEDYRVRCCAVRTISDGELYSDWTEYTASVGTIPSAPASILTLRATSETSVHIAWEAVANADTYDIEYATKQEYLEGSDATTTVSGIETTTYELTGLESGSEYFFRVRAVNDQGESGWSGIKSVVIGEKPTAPTTWSSTTTVVTGEPLTLYWIHNTVDGSKMKYAELELTVGSKTWTETIEGPDTDDSEEEKTNSYSVDTSTYTEGTKIEWRVRTAGITLQYSDWSVKRVVDVYAPVTLELNITNQNDEPLEVVTTFPFYIDAFAGPKTQEPIGYYVSIISNSMYRTTDNIGNFKMVNKGEEVYSNYFDTSNALLVEMTPANVDLQDGISYTVTCIVSMNSGLTAQQTVDFTVSWTDVLYEPDAEIGIDKDTYSAYIRPYCIDSEGNAINEVLLGVYRRDFDGTFTELATGIESGDIHYITDPHPALDYARYRITATSKTTGAVSYYDVPGYPVGCFYIVIQWDDEWSNFAADSEDELEQSPWSGSMLKLPYNIDVSDTNSPDVALIEYIGRQNPVSYYGTQRGYSSTWNTVIPKTDVDTLALLRKLQTWMGDVYVREPSGSGYWANLTVSFNQKHDDLTIPITINLKRVEGGI